MPWIAARGLKNARAFLFFVAFYGAILVALAALMVAFTCLIGELLLRYPLPAWEAVWIALILAMGATDECMKRRKRIIKCGDVPERVGTSE